MSQSPQNIIEQAWENRANLSPDSAPGDVRNAVNAVLEGLNAGTIRVAERRDVGKWEVNQWVKKAVLLSFRLEDNKPMSAGGYTQFYDKVPSKFENYTAADFAGRAAADLEGRSRHHGQWFHRAGGHLVGGGSCAGGRLGLDPGH